VRVVGRLCDVAVYAAEFGEVAAGLFAGRGGAVGCAVIL
jgi:hypothetical protein